MEAEARDFLRAEVDRRKREEVAIAEGRVTRKELREAEFSKALEHLRVELKTIRLARGFSLRETGRRAPFGTYRSFGEIECGQCEPTCRMLWGLARALKVTIEISPRGIRVLR